MAGPHAHRPWLIYGLAALLVCAGVWSLFKPPPAGREMQEIPAGPLATDSAGRLLGRDGRPIPWTREPTRVDPGTQDFERVAEAPSVDPFPVKFNVPRRVRLIDSATFEFDGTTYRLADIAPIPLDKVCIEADGRRWACGARARIVLTNMVAGKRIHCRMAGDDPRSPVIDCLHARTSTMSRTLLAERLALPVAAATDPEEGRVAVTN